MMRGTMWMVYDRDGYARNKDYSALYRDICKPFGIGVEVVLAEEAEEWFVCHETPLFVLVRTICPAVNAFFEQREIPVFNSSKVSRICNDKGRTLQYVRESVLSVPSLSFSNQELPRLLLKSTDECRQMFLDEYPGYFDREKERELIGRAADFVIKAVDGHGGSQVFSLEKERNLISDGIKESNIVLQPMIFHGGTACDTRVYVIGKEMAAMVRRESSTDFRANFSLGSHVTGVALKHCSGSAMPEYAERAVRTVLDMFDFGMAGIDFILGEDGTWILNEIEDVAGARMLYQCVPDFNLAEEYIQYILKEKLHIM